MLILDLENICVNVEDEDQALLLLSSLLRSYATFKETLLYGRESLSFDDVQSTLNSKELNQKIETTSSTKGECLMIRGRPEEKKKKTEEIKKVGINLDQSLNLDLRSSANTITKKVISKDTVLKK